jgi:hypothetical protein
MRCAIYTRKSSEEGLEQAFNSLDAQREACTAFVLSQKHEGWAVLPALYDDGGFSGGTMDRPALQRLLSDICAGQVDVVVVYKIDRLTRSLFDFAKIVEAFDVRGVSFVSITQQFNTTTSMGRLTLNGRLPGNVFATRLPLPRRRECGWVACRPSATMCNTESWLSMSKRLSLFVTSSAATSSFDRCVPYKPNSMTGASGASGGFLPMAPKSEVKGSPAAPFI